MSDSNLTAQQLQVIDALSIGVTMTDAAAQAGVHRNTIANWRRNSADFRTAIVEAQYDQALNIREKIEARLDLAFKTLDELFSDPKTPPSIRFKAALTIIQHAVTLPKPQIDVVTEVRKAVYPIPPSLLHNLAQSAPPPAPSPRPSSSASSTPAVHNRAQSAQAAVQTIRRVGPKIGPNDRCPCGSGLKYKRCCRDKADLNKAA